MYAMVLNEIGGPLLWTELPDPHSERCQIRVAVVVCGVCRADLHVVDEELPDPQFPIIPAHGIVGRIFSPIVITPRHLAKRAPIKKYSCKRSRNPSRPSVIFSPG